MKINIVLARQRYSLELVRYILIVCIVYTCLLDYCVAIQPLVTVGGIIHLLGGIHGEIAC